MCRVPVDIIHCADNGYFINLTCCLIVDNISKFVEDPGICGDEGGVSSLRDGGVLSGLTPDLQ